MSESPIAVKDEPRIPRFWLKWLIIAFTLIGWIILVCFGLWVVSQAIGAVVLIILASFISSLLSPLAHFLRGMMSSVLAKILLALVLVGVSLLVSLVMVRLLRTQLVDTIQLVQSQLSLTNPPTPLQEFLAVLNISPEQMLQFKTELVQYIRSGISPLNLVRNVVQMFTAVLVIATLGLFFLFDTAVFDAWLCSHIPTSQRKWVRTFLSALERGVTNSLRKMLLLSLIISILIGAVAALFHLPSALLITVIAFFLQFFPGVGGLLIVLISGLLASSQGWGIAVPVMLLVIVVLALRLVIKVVVSPHLSGKVQGLHPIVALLTLLVGGQLFGFWGTLLALPIARFLQDLLGTFWSTWRHQHPEEFSDDQAEAQATQAKPVRKE